MFLLRSLTTYRHKRNIYNFRALTYAAASYRLFLDAKYKTTFSISISVTNLFVCLQCALFLLPFVFALIPKAVLT